MTAVLPGPHPDEMDPRMRKFWSCSLTFGEALPWNPTEQDAPLVYGLRISQVGVGVCPLASGSQLCGWMHVVVVGCE
jgi:hypothetical protein